jgi:hypothetical protein
MRLFVGNPDERIGRFGKAPRFDAGRPHLANPISMGPTRFEFVTWSLSEAMGNFPKNSETF